MRGLAVALLLFAMLAPWPAAAQDATGLADAVRVPSRLTLDEALRLAEARSPALLEARARTAVAEADALGAPKRPNPSLEVEFRGYPLFEPDLPSFLDTQELTIAVDQEFEPGDRRRWRREAAQLGAQASAAESLDVLRRLRLEVQRAYVHVVLAQADVEATRATLEDVDRVLSINRARYEQGELSGVELRRLQVERHRFADDGLMADLALRNARSRLLALLNVRPLDQPFETVDRLPEEGALPPLGPAPAAGSIPERADLRALRFGEARAEADARLQHALRIPPFSLGAGYQRDFGTNAVVVRATVPLALWNRNEGGRARAAAERTLAASRTSAASAAAELEVQLARNAVESSRTRVAVIAGEYVKNAREARDIVLAAYRAGAATLIDYLDAQRAFRDAQRSEHRARFDYRVSVFELEAAAGTSGPAVK
jgi:cobalt-zinc-cadmium efflux system outer membrane protein